MRVAAPLLLSACGPGGVFTPQGRVRTGSPILTARSGATTALTIIACPAGFPSADQFRAMGENQRARGTR